MSDTNLLEGLISHGEAARQIGCNPRTLSRWENQPNGLPSLIIAGRKYYRIEALREFIAKRERFPNPREAA